VAEGDRIQARSAAGVKKEGLSRWLRPWQKNVAERPRAKEGGREEEEKRSRIADGLIAPVRLRDRKVVVLLL
jgi:hypothetical protein